MEVWQPAYIGIGSNLNDPEAQVRAAVERIAAVRGTRLIEVSSFYGSAPFGPVAQPDFVNAVAGMLTQRTPEELLVELKAIEKAMGRTDPHEKWGPRVIDLDLLLLGAERRSGPQLTLPHPGIVERNFVLYPLAEIAPEAEVPGSGRVAGLKARVASAGVWPLDRTTNRTSA